jgi:hypothetical protein
MQIFLILIIYLEDNRDYLLLQISNVRKSDVNQSVNIC